MIPLLSFASSLFATSTQGQTPSGVDPTPEAGTAQEGSFGQVAGQMGTVIQDIKDAEAEASARIHIAMRRAVQSMILDHSVHTRVADPPPNIASANQTISET
jgi:hypothetical protein